MAFFKSCGRFDAAADAYRRGILQVGETRVGKAEISNAVLRARGITRPAILVKKQEE